jgi:hypothetical protein
MTTRRTIVVGALVAATALGGAGVAAAASPADDLGQGGSAVVATLENAVASFVDAIDGREPEGADGLETEFPDVDPRFVEGPLGGLLDQPLE